MRLVGRIRLVAMLAILSASAIGAQVAETPVAFDSTGRVRSITPALAARLGLGAPVWPIGGVYTNVLLYETSEGKFVLAALQETGVIIRYEISAEQRSTLQAQVSAAMSLVGRPATEANEDIISERASGAFMRDQLGLAFTLYGGTLATLADDETLSPALYLMAPAATFFIAGNYVRQHPISRAQNDLASDLAMRTAVAGLGALYVMGVEDQPKAYAAAMFAGGLTGTATGLRLGRGMTDGEAHGVTFGSTTAAITTFGLLGASGLVAEGQKNLRGVVGGVIAAGAAGMPLGLGYVRKARYVITAGDLTAMGLASVLGTAVTLIPLVESENTSEQLAFALLTAGYTGGLVLGDRLFVRPYDHTPGEAGLLGVGATAGALMTGGVGILVSAENPTAIAALLTGGAIAGVVITEKLIEPRRARDLASAHHRSADQRRLRVSFSPAAIAQAAMRVPGRSTALTIRF